MSITFEIRGDHQSVGVNQTVIELTMVGLVNVQTGLDHQQVVGRSV